MDNLLVRGLRNRSRSDSPRWETLVTDIILSKWPTPQRTPATVRAEAGLGIVDTPYYFYAMRTHRDYGLVVFVLKQVDDIHETPPRRGATPFDTGGLWHGTVKTSPELDSAGRGALFREADTPLHLWPAAFSRYLRDNYSRVVDYISGTPPLHPIDPILGRPSNESRAWTWEVRYSPTLAAQHLKVATAFMREDERDVYLDWLWTASQLDDGLARSAQSWISANVVLCESPSVSAEEQLRREASR